MRYRDRGQARRRPAAQRRGLRETRVLAQPVVCVVPYAEARRRGYEIVYPLTDEPWGLRRFFVRAPDGNILNIAGHRDA